MYVVKCLYFLPLILGEIVNPCPAESGNVLPLQTVQI